MTVLQGLLAGLSLIVAIGAQNAFVLRQGLRGEHVGLVVAVCTGADLALIAAGTAGLGALLGGRPGALTAARFAGVALLVALGAVALRRALRPGRLDPAADVPAATGTVLATTLGLTFLNPHVYLDTVLLLGAMAAQHGPARWGFAAGAGGASALWFAALGFGAARLRPLLARPGAWRVLELSVGVVMLVLAGRLAFLPPA